jgi:polysaccharide deacetylase 2 family uncharacterized protein YibQ
MAYTPYQLPSGKVVRIPMEEINKQMHLLKLSKDEAIQMYLEDEGYLENEEQEALERKAKENRITATIHQAKAEYKEKTQRERVKKDDPTKEGIIKAIAEMLPSVNAENVEIVNAGKLITFTIGADKYKLDLIRQRPPKENKG